MADAMEARPPSAVQKTTFTVLGICCSSEIKLIDRILNHLEGIENVSVNVLAKTATVVHDPAKAPASRIGITRRFFFFLLHAACLDRQVSCFTG